MSLSEGVNVSVADGHPGAARRRRRRGSLGAIRLIGVIAAGVLAGCGLSESGVGTLALDPGRYALYHCNDLVERLKALTAREAELRNLIDKASESTGGALIGTLAYRTDYETALSDEKLVRRIAAEKKCDLGPRLYQSDQTIR